MNFLFCFSRRVFNLWNGIFATSMSRFVWNGNFWGKLYKQGITKMVKVSIIKSQRTVGLVMSNLVHVLSKVGLVMSNFVQVLWKVGLVMSNLIFCLNIPWNSLCYCFAGEACDLVNGTCPDDLCDFGHQGETCSETCDDGFFGVNCASLCGRCENEEICSPETGQCNRCQLGYQPPYCNETCITGNARNILIVWRLQTLNYPLSCLTGQLQVRAPN